MNKLLASLVLLISATAFADEISCDKFLYSAQAVQEIRQDWKRARKTEMPAAAYRELVKAHAPDQSTAKYLRAASAAVFTLPTALDRNGRQFEAKITGSCEATNSLIALKAATANMDAALEAAEVELDALRR